MEALLSMIAVKEVIHDVRGDVKIHNRWLLPKCCSILQLSIAFAIEGGCNWLLNMGAATPEC